MIMMKILIGIPADLDEKMGTGFFDAYMQLRKALSSSNHDIITFAPSGGDIKLTPIKDADTINTPSGINLNKRPKKIANKKFEAGPAIETFNSPYFWSLKL